MHVPRHVVGEIPRLAALPHAGERKLDRGQVATVIAVPSTNQQRDQIARLDGQVFNGFHLDLGISLGCAGGQTPSDRAAPQFQRPSDAIAALGVCMGHLRFDVHRRRDRTSPADRGPQRLRRMDGHAVRLHVARDPHVLVGRIGDQQRRGVCPPAVDEFVPRCLADLAREMPVDLERTAAADAEVIEPRSQRLSFDAVFLGKPWNVGLSLGRGRFVGGVQIGRRAGKNAIPAHCQFASHFANVAQQQVRPAWLHQTRFFPNHEIVLCSITGVGDDQRQCHFIGPEEKVLGRRRNFESHLLAGRNGTHRRHPRLRTADLADVSHRPKPPQFVLPSCNVSHQLGGVFGRCGSPAGANAVENG